MHLERLSWVAPDRGAGAVHLMRVCLGAAMESLGSLIQDGAPPAGVMWNHRSLTLALCQPQTTPED